MLAYADVCGRMLTLVSCRPRIPIPDGALPATRREDGSATPAAPAAPAEPSALLRVEQSGIAAFALEAYEHSLLRVLSGSAVAQVHCKS
jgi:hypothetical protein